MVTIDFETYSDAGYVFNETRRRWQSIERNKNGIASVGMAVYAEHPSTEVLSLAWDLGGPPSLWVPGMAPPLPLFQHIAAGGLVEAHNSTFEYYIWLHVCGPRMGWPPLPLHQLRCSMSKARAWALPGYLEKAINALNTGG